MLEIKNRDLSAHLALANSRIDFSKQDIHSMWKEVIYYREKYHVLHRQHQEVLRAHSACSNGPPEQPYIHLVQELEKLQDMYRHILGQNTTLKFEVQRLTQQCVTAGLIPPPQNYIVTPAPALQLVRKPSFTSPHFIHTRDLQPAVQPGAARRASEPGVGQQQQPQVQYNQVCSTHLLLSLSPFHTTNRQHNRDRFHGSSPRHHLIHMQRTSQAIQPLLRGQTRHTTTTAPSFPRRTHKLHNLCRPLSHKETFPLSNNRFRPLGLDKSSISRIPTVNVPLSVHEWVVTPTRTRGVLPGRRLTSNIKCTLVCPLRHLMKSPSRETSSREHGTTWRLSSHNNITRNSQGPRTRTSKFRRLRPLLILVSTDRTRFRMSPLRRHQRLWLWTRTVSLDRCTRTLRILRTLPPPMPVPEKMIPRFMQSDQRELL